MAVVNLHVKIIRCYARDSIANVLAACGFDNHDHVLVRAMANDTEKAGKLRLNKPPIECELAALKSLCRRKRGFGFSGSGALRGSFRRCSRGKPQSRGML